MGRKHCGKRRNCSLRAISPFPTAFSKGLLPRGVKRCCCVGMFFSLTLSQTTNFRRLKKPERLKLQTTISNLMKTAEFFKWVENAVGKGEIARYEQFLLFPQCFQKTYKTTYKNQGLFGKGLTLTVLHSCFKRF